MQLADLASSPNGLARHYSRFRVGERLLLTGHSHQAWPDAAEAGQLAAFTDAARLVDQKWGQAFAKAERLKHALSGMLDDPSGSYALGANTHELVLRFLSALPWHKRRRLVTTDGEFHTLRRQLARFEEEGIEVRRVAASPAASIAERLAEAVDDSTAAVLVSAVFFGSGEIARHLGEVARACERHGAELLLDAYHSTGVVPLSLRDQGLEGAFVVGGGYKYLQQGEGNCFLRVPPATNLRPVFTGWYAEFELLGDEPDPHRVRYGAGAAAFAGATYDPSSHYRAIAVLDFWEDQGLTPDFLREVSQHQVGLLIERFDALDLPPTQIDRDRNLPLADRGGFLALTTSHAASLSAKLKERGVFTDHRGDILRLGPAPYLSDTQLETAVELLGEAVRELRGDF